MIDACNTLEALAEKLQNCLECTALNNGLQVNIHLKLTRLDIVGNELRDIEMQMENLQKIRALKLTEIEELERQTNALQVQLLNNECGSV